MQLILENVVDLHAYVCVCVCVTHRHTHSIGVF